MALLIFYVSLALGVSFACSLMEAVLLSVTPSFIIQIEKQKPSLGRRLAEYKEDVDRPLAAILSLNTIAHTVGAAGAGAQATRIFGEAYFGVISAVLTLLILVLSEIIPKTLGAVYWRWLARHLVVRFLLAPTMLLMTPLVWMSQKLTKLIAPGKKEGVSREELAALAEAGRREGVVHEDESRIFKNLLRFTRVRTSDVMTPRTVIFALPQTITVEQALAENPQIRFSRIPIYGRNHDDITGFVLKSDLLLAAADERSDVPLEELSRELVIVPAHLSLRGLFERLMKDRAHLALVVDEYGGTAGLVSLEDLLETLLGLEIVDEADAVHDMQELARRQWKERARGLGLLIEEEGKG